MGYTNLSGAVHVDLISGTTAVPVRIRIVISLGLSSRVARYTNLATTSNFSDEPGDTYFDDTSNQYPQGFFLLNNDNRLHFKYPGSNRVFVASSTGLASSITWPELYAGGVGNLMFDGGAPSYGLLYLANMGGNPAGYKRDFPNSTTTY